MTFILMFGHTTDTRSIEATPTTVGASVHTKAMYY